MLVRHRNTGHHTSDSKDEIPTTTTPYSDLLNCRRLAAPLRVGFGEPLVPSGSGKIVRGILEDVGAENIVAPFVVIRPSTPLSLAKPTEPEINPVRVFSYLGHG